MLGEKAYGSSPLNDPNTRKEVVYSVVIHADEKLSLFLLEPFLPPIGFYSEI